MIKMRAFLVLVLTSTARAMVDPPIHIVKNSPLEKFEQPPPEHIFSENAFSIPRDTNDSTWNKSNSESVSRYNLKSLIDLETLVDNTMLSSYDGVMDIPGFTYQELRCLNGRLSTTRKLSEPEPFVLVGRSIGTIWMYSDVGDLSFEYQNCSNGLNITGLNITGEFSDNRVYWQVSVKRVGKFCLAKLEKYKLVNPSDLEGQIEAEVVEQFKGIEGYITRSLVPRYHQIIRQNINAKFKDFTEHSAINTGVDTACRAFFI